MNEKLVAYRAIKNKMFPSGEKRHTPYAVPDLPATAVNVGNVTFIELFITYVEPFQKDVFKLFPSEKAILFPSLLTPTPRQLADTEMPVDVRLL